MRLALPRMLNRTQKLVTLFIISLVLPGCANTSPNDLTIHQNPPSATTSFTNTFDDQTSDTQAIAEDGTIATWSIAESNLDLAGDVEADSGAEEVVLQSTAQNTTLSFPDDWRDMPVVPVISPAMAEVYRQGQTMGRDARSLSVIGDCQNVADFFLARFDKSGQYDLGDYDYLQETIDYYSGSFSRERVAVSGGFNVAAVLSPLWNDLEVCEAHESPLACEYRINNPSVAIISMETWWYDRPADTYASYLSQIVEYSLEQGVVPILATKADNLEGDNSINAAIVQVAQEYNVPLWNFWRAVQPIPGHGLTEDQFHLTYARPYFNLEENMRTGWAWRNLTALQAIDAVRRGVLDLDPPPITDIEFGS